MHSPIASFSQNAYKRNTLAHLSHSNHNRMPEYRQDPVTGRRVIVAANRAGRPDEFQRVPQQRREGDCPFCAGNEAMTPCCVATYSTSGEDGGPWQVRVIENKYPAVECEAVAQLTGWSWYESLPAAGKHEVVVESPRHVASISQVRDRLVELTMRAYRDRIRALREADAFQYVHVFKNVGSEAGASIEHSHSQIIALPEVPIGVAAELDGALKYCRKHGRNVFLDILAKEQHEEQRVLAETEHLIAFCPYASRFPFETWVMRRDGHAPAYEDSDDVVLNELAGLVKRIVSAMESTLNLPAYNYWIHNSPFDRKRYDHYHWHMEIIPRITTPAGFEWGCGMHINPVLPEEAAAKLREAMG